MKHCKQVMELELDLLCCGFGGDGGKLTALWKGGKKCFHNYHPDLIR